MPLPAETVVGRLRAIERELNAPPGSRLAYSHAQLVKVAELVRDGVAEAEAWKQVGPPSAVVKPGEKSHAELIVEVLSRGPPEARHLVEATDHGAPARLMRAADDQGEVG